MKRLFRNLNTKRKIFKFILIFFLIFITLCGIVLQNRKPASLQRHNYLLDSNVKQDSFLVDTLNCKIPNLDPWADSIKSHFSKISKPVQDCRKFKKWTFTVGNEIIFNKTAIERDGYSWDRVSCCLTQIERQTQSPERQDKDADNLVKYSECVPLKEMRTGPLLGEFCMITCHEVIFGFFEMWLIYRDFHSIVTISDDKRKNDDKKDFDDKPPNVVILGIDSTSRLNFRRMMPRTVAKLEELKAVELKGYTKVGDNTFPNFCALLAGKSEESLQRGCYSRSTPLDKCPWIFKRFAEKGYITSFAEDSPFSTGFNHYRTGFAEKPVDHYFRPFMIAVHEHEWASRWFRIRNYYEGCVGPRTNDEALLDYALSVVDASSSSSSPAFAMSWSSAASHDAVTGIAHSDDAYTTALDQLGSKGHLRNTLLIVMSDHGYRYGPVRETLQGWYEDKLPFVWIRLGEDIVRRFPQWGTNLEKNANRLSSPFVLHATLLLLLEKYAVQNGTKSERYKIPEKSTPNFLSSLILENTTCDEAGIPKEYCACHYPHKIVDPTSDPNVNLAASVAIKYVNEMILSKNKKCGKLSVHEVTSAGRMEMRGQGQDNLDFIYIVAFVTNPGGFLIEAEVGFGFKRGPKVIQVHRASGMHARDIRCLNGEADAEVELWCFCEK